MIFSDLTALRHGWLAALAGLILACPAGWLAGPLRFCFFLGETQKSRVEGVGEPQNQQAQKGSQTPQNTLPKIFNIYNTNR